MPSAGVNRINRGELSSPPKDPGTTRYVWVSRRKENSDMPAIDSSTMAEKRIPGCIQLGHWKEKMQLTSVQEAGFMSTGSIAREIKGNSRFPHEQDTSTNEAFQQLHYLELVCRSSRRQY
jgi:hypothetical protein